MKILMIILCGVMFITGCNTIPNEVDSMIHVGRKQGKVTIKVEEASELNLEIVKGGYATAENPAVIDAKVYPNYIMFEVFAKNSGTYLLSATFSTEKERPVSIYVNENKVSENVGLNTTGDWRVKSAKEVLLDKIDLSKGINKIKIERNGSFFHLTSISLELQK